MTSGAGLQGPGAVGGLTRVGFLRHDFLPPSETFIYTQMRALERYEACPFAIRRRSATKFPADNVVSLDGHPFEAQLYAATAWSPRFVRWAKSVRLIHAHMGFTGAHALQVARRFDLPLVTSYYGADVTLRRSRLRFKPEYWRYGVLAPTLWRRGDRFLVLSAHMRDDLVAQGCPADKIRIVPLGIDFTRFGAGGERAPAPRDQPVTVLMVGREVDKKGFDDGLAACAAARDAGVALRVLFLGMGRAGAAELRALATRLGLAVDWLDPATPVPGVMAQADILLVPSRTAANGDQEGTPTVICEGSAAGLAIVSTRHAGIPEQVEHGQTGLLAAERDVAGLAAHLVTLARDPDMRHAMGVRGRTKMVREFSLAALRDNLQTVYDELLR